MPDINTTVSFTIMQVKYIKGEDWKKTVRMMRYLCVTPNLRLTLRTYITNVVKVWVAGSHRVHPNCKINT